MTVSSPRLRPLIIRVNCGKDCRAVPEYSSGCCERKERRSLGVGTTINSDNNIYLTTCNVYYCCSRNETSTTIIRYEICRGPSSNKARAYFKDASAVFHSRYYAPTTKHVNAPNLKLVDNVLAQVLERLNVFVTSWGRSLQWSMQG